MIFGDRDLNNVSKEHSVADLMYLGGEICKDDGSDADVDCRVRKAKAAFGVHSQTALKYAYLKAMTYQFCCTVQALGKSPNQSAPNFKSL